MFSNDDMTEVCGRCNREQQSKEGNSCKICGRPTITFNSKYENYSEKIKQWKRLNGE